MRNKTPSSKKAVSEDVSKLQARLAKREQKITELQRDLTAKEAHIAQLRLKAGPVSEDIQPDADRNEIIVDDELNASRIAALNLVEDAVAAQRKLEQSNAELQKEIAERKQIEEELRNSEERYKLMFEHAPLAINITHNTTITYANPAYLKMFGYSSLEELQGVRPLELFAPESRPRILDNIQRRAKGLPTPNNYEAECLRRDGTKFPILMYLTSVVFSAQPVTLGFILDITERKQSAEQLRASEMRFSKIFDSSPIGISISRLSDGVFTDANDALLKIFDCSRDQVIGQNSLEVYNWTNPDERDRMFALLRTNGRLLGFDIQIQTKTGIERDLQISAEIIALENEAYMLGMVHDVSERKQAEEKLKESEIRFRSLYENSTIGIYRTTPDGKILLSNPALLQMLGYPSFEELAQRNLEADGYEAGYERNKFRMQIERDGEVRGLESSWKKKDGTPIFIRESAKSIRDSDGKVLYYEGTVEDITERKAAEEAVRKASLYNRSLIEASLDALVTIGPDGKITDINASTEAVTGFKRNELIGTDFSDYFTDPDKARSGYQRVFREGLVRDYPLELKRRDGPVIPVLYNAAVYHDEQGDLIGVFAAARDITERKHAEEKLRESEERFRTLIEQSVDGIVLIDEQGRVIEWNPAEEKITGIPRANALGAPVWDIQYQILIPEHRAELNPEYLKKLFLDSFQAGDGEQLGKPQDIEVLSVNGERKFIQQISFRIKTKNGNRVGSIFRDITLHKRAEKALSESEQHFHSLFDHMLEGYAYCKMIYENDQPSDFIYLEVNDAFEKLTGIKEAAGKKVSEIIPGIRESNPELLEIYGSAARTGESTKFETYVGELKIWFSVSVYSLKKDYFVAVFDNITERKRAEESIAESNRQLAALVTSLDDIVFELDEQGTYLNVWTADEGLLAQPKTKLLGQRIRDILPEAIAQPVEESIRRALNDNEVEEVEYPLDLAYGRRWFLARVSAIVSPDGSSKTVSMLIRDITERRQAEQAVRENEQRFRTFIEQSVDGAVLIDEQEKIIEWNSAQEKITGISKVQAIGSSFAEMQYKLLPPSRQAQTSVKYLKDAMQNAFHSGESPQFAKPVAVEIRTLTGEQKFLMQNAFPIKTERGFRIGSVIHDITESVQAETTIRQRLTELELVYQSGMELSRVLEPEEIAQKIIEQMEKSLNWHHTAVRLYDPESQTLKVIGFNVPGLENEIDREGLEGHFNNLIQKLGDGLSGWVVQHGQTLRIGDLKRDPHFVETFPGLNSGLYVPIKTESRILGVISVENELPNAFRESDERLIGTLANQAAIALENSRLNNDTQQQLNRLKALHAIDLAITNSLDLNVTLDVLLNQVIQQLQVDAVVIFLKEANLNDLKYVLSRGFHTHLLENVSPDVLLKESNAERAVMERRIIEAQAPLEGGFKEIWMVEGFHSVYAIPLLSKGEPKGVMEVFSRSKDQAVTRDQVSFLETLAGQAAIAIENLHLFDGLQRSNMELAIAYDATIEGWSRAMDLRDKETEGHTKRVVDMMLKLAADFDFSGEMLMHIRHGALLHDIGKLGVPDNILLKPDKLTDEEWVMMRKHPTFAFEMLSPIRYLSQAMNIPYCHHEKWDGTGYPRGLSGEQIPLEARIFAVVDVWDAVTSDRPYRKAWSKEKAMEHIRSLAGTHFDPRVVERFLELKKKEDRQR